MAALLITAVFHWRVGSVAGEAWRQIHGNLIGPYLRSLHNLPMPACTTLTA
jgi:hypothetical protein